MWTFNATPLEEGRGLQFRVLRDGQAVSYEAVVQGWRHDGAFRGAFNQCLANHADTPFRWETPAVDRSNAGQTFEFVLLESPSLSRPGDPRDFAAHFREAHSGGVVTFTNLGGDATLVVPCPAIESPAYGHLAAFVRHAPAAQRDLLWQKVGEAMAERIGDRPVWLSTAGAGVPWLHVRLDDRPKYYGYGPYRASRTA